ncbi:Hydroxymethylglutaryl-CoA lyase YngG [bacterium HR24]|jgi:hydroxymethylglutaryl-CoA lyase|nr:Hydroxymethylglutaryl-CoA lyase YngG [bacterium HR24]
MKLPERVVITEVGPRDGLQNEARIIPLEDKVALIDRLSETGLKRVEAASFVHPRAIPQMANAAEVMAGIRRRPGVTYVALVPNEVGARNAIAAGADELAVVVSASESHNRANLNRAIAETLQEIAKVARLAEEAGLPWAGYISTAFGCPYEGAVDPDKVLSLARQLRDLGAYAVALGDTIGVANPRQVYELASRFFAEVPGVPLRLHFHDTRGAALANVLAAMQAGADQFDGSIGGLGGCPYAPGASGNVATEDMVAMLEAMGVETGVDLQALVEVSWFAEQVVGRPLEGRVRRALRKRD